MVWHREWNSDVTGRYFTWRARGRRILLEADGLSIHVRLWGAQSRRYDIALTRCPHISALRWGALARFTSPKVETSDDDKVSAKISIVLTLTLQAKRGKNEDSKKHTTPGIRW